MQNFDAMSLWEEDERLFKNMTYERDEPPFNLGEELKCFWEEDEMRAMSYTDFYGDDFEEDYEEEDNALGEDFSQHFFDQDYCTYIIRSHSGLSIDYNIDEDTYSLCSSDSDDEIESEFDFGDDNKKYFYT